MNASAVSQHVAEIASDGWTIIPNAIEPALVDALRGDLERLEHALDIRPAGNSFEGAATWRIYNLLVHGSLYQQIPMHANVLPVVEGALDSGCLVSSLSSIAIGPGEVAQPIHADDQLIPIPKPHVATVCNTMWALTDFTAANGATRLVPGSHAADHSPDVRRAVRHDPRGDGRGQRARVARIALARRRREHAPTQRRVGIAMNYCAGWIRQQENQQLGIPREIAAGFSPRLRELCRVRHLPRAHRAHRQARPGRAARRSRCRGADGVGSHMTVREVSPGPARRALVPLIRLAEDSESQLESAIDDGTMYVAEEGETPIGVVLVLDHGEQERELRYVAIAESHQRKGLGKAMLADVRAAEAARGAARLLVGTSSADTGNLDFYQRCGYRLLSIERDYFTPVRGYPPDFVLNGLPAVDMVWMDLEI